jgi:ADP-heptose:LPS heptosyltransferase
VHPIAVCTNPLSAPPPAERILVIRLGAVGDVVRTLPAVSALRAGYPRARITWLVEPPSASLLSAQTWIDEVLVFPRPELLALLRAGRLGALWRALRELRRELHARRFDLAVDFHAILKSGILARLSGARLRASYARPYAREGAWLFADLRARIEPRRASRFARNLALVRFLGVGAPPAPEPLAVAAETRARARAALGGGPAPVVLHPGTSDTTPHKRWSVSGYAELARALAHDTGTPVLVSAGPAADDRALADAIVAAADGAALRAPPTPSLADLAALFAAARLYVGSDTGPMHVASLVGTPVVQLLGPTDPVENQPFEGTPSRSLRVPVACSPCRRGCAAAICMQVLRPAAVIAAARELLFVAAPRPNR